MKTIYNLLATVGKILLGIANFVSIVALVMIVFVLYVIICFRWLFQGGYMKQSLWEVITNIVDDMILRKRNM